jgi:hypothetical protein
MSREHQVQHGRDQHDGRANWQEGSEGREHGEHHGRWQANQRKADTDECTLNQGRRHGPEYDCPNNIAQISHELAAGPWLHRNETDETLEHDATVTQQEEEQKQHHEETNQRSHDAQCKAATHGRSRFQHGLSAIQDPALNLIGSDWSILAHPLNCSAHDGNRIQTLQQVWIRQSGLRHGSKNVGHLPGEYDSQEGERRHYEEGSQPGQNACRQRRSPLEPGRESFMQRVQQESKHRGPAERGPQRLEYRRQRPTENDQCDDDERSAIEG